MRPICSCCSDNIAGVFLSMCRSIDCNSIVVMKSKIPPLLWQRKEVKECLSKLIKTIQNILMRLWTCPLNFLGAWAKPLPQAMCIGPETTITFWGTRVFRHPDQRKWNSLNCAARKVVRKAKRQYLHKGLTVSQRIEGIDWVKTLKQMYINTDRQLERVNPFSRLLCNRVQEKVLSIFEIRYSLEYRAEKHFRGYKKDQFSMVFVRDSRVSLFPNTPEGARQRIKYARRLITGDRDSPGKEYLVDGSVRYLVREGALRHEERRQRLDGVDL